MFGRLPRGKGVVERLFMIFCLRRTVKRLSAAVKLTIATFRFYTRTVFGHG